jgi:hypothetical protein
MATAAVIPTILKGRATASVIVAVLVLIRVAMLLSNFLKGVDRSNTLPIPLRGLPAPAR